MYRKYTYFQDMYRNSQKVYISVLICIESIHIAMICIEIRKNYTYPDVYMVALRNLVVNDRLSLYN